MSGRGRRSNGAGERVTRPATMGGGASSRSSRSASIGAEHGLPLVEPMAAIKPGERPTGELAPLYAAAVATLTWGFRTGAALLAAGIVLALARREPLNREADPFAEVIPAVLDGRAAGVVDLAILWLMVVPVGAVLVVAGGFLRLGDRRYALLSLLVLAVLGVSIALALGR